MTEEQAVERCHQLLETKHSNWLGLSNQQAIAILIDMLKEKDTEIEKLKKENEHWKNGFERELEDNRKNTYELLKQNLTIREKDKQIDLMAEEIEKGDIEFTEYCKFKIVCDRNCKHCIEQYFKRKAKE